MKWVAASVPPSRRRENLSWKHHANVAGLPPEQQDHWLEVASVLELSASKLRATIKDKAEVDKVNDEHATRVVEEHVGGRILSIEMDMTPDIPEEPIPADIFQGPRSLEVTFQLDGFNPAAVEYIAEKSMPAYSQGTFTRHEKQAMRSARDSICLYERGEFDVASTWRIALLTGLSIGLESPRNWVAIVERFLRRYGCPQDGG